MALCLLVLHVKIRQEPPAKKMRGQGPGGLLVEKSYHSSHYVIHFHPFFSNAIHLSEQKFVLASSLSTAAQILISTPYVFRERKNEKTS